MLKPSLYDQVISKVMAIRLNKEKDKLQQTVTIDMVEASGLMSIMGQQR